LEEKQKEAEAKPIEEEAAKPHCILTQQKKPLFKPFFSAKDKANYTTVEGLELENPNPFAKNGGKVLENTQKSQHVITPLVAEEGLCSVPHLLQHT
jgi:hypothetical protein